MEQDKHKKDPDCKNWYGKQNVERYGGLIGILVYLLFNFFVPDKGKNAHNRTETDKQNAKKWWISGRRGQETVLCWACLFQKVSGCLRKRANLSTTKQRPLYLCWSVPTQGRSAHCHMYPAVAHSGMHTFFKTTCHIVIISNALSLASLFLFSYSWW